MCPLIPYRPSISGIKKAKKRGLPPTVMNPSKPEIPSRKPRFRFFKAISSYYRQIVPDSAISVAGFALCFQPETSFCVQARGGCFCQSSHGSLPTRIWHKLLIAACTAIRLSRLFTPLVIQYLFIKKGKNLLPSLHLLPKWIPL